MGTDLDHKHILVHFKAHIKRPGITAHSFDTVSYNMIQITRDDVNSKTIIRIPVDNIDYIEETHYFKEEEEKKIDSNPDLSTGVVA